MTYNDDAIYEMEEELDAVKAELDALKLEVVRWWEPIETAPKDKSVILISSERHGVVAAKFWDESEDGLTFFDTIVGGGPMRLFYDASHWMPLPEAPSTSLK